MHDDRAINYLYKMLSLAENRTEKLGIAFKREDYKWVLGVRVLSDIVIRDRYVNYPDQPATLFGIVVERDYANPDNVQLWENITNKL